MTDSIPLLGRLRNVDLREVWPSEPGSFTPWLAQPDNLQFLAEAVGLAGLEPIATEHPVDIFAADIVARTPGDQMVLIENQIERSDHTHLGQILTYAAGVDAPIIIWIARQFTEGHRAALDWLNRITPEEFAFFGVEVEALRIGDSAPAPRFNVVSRPNAWTRQLKAASAQAESTPQNAAHLAFWSGYEAVAKGIGAPIRTAPNQPVKGPNYYVRVGQKGQAYLTAFHGLSTGKVGIYLSVYGANAGATFEALLARKHEIEQAFGGPMEWLVRKEGQVYWIGAGRLDARPDEADWPRQQTWLAETMKRLAMAATPVVLEAQDVEPDNSNGGLV